jgi:hypothetical protein
MTDATNRPPERDALQFDTAEPTADAATATSLACTLCKKEISTSYYEVNGAVVCASCRDQIHAQLTGGSEGHRFAKAAGLGLLGAAAGSALYYAILALTGYHIGLVAVAVGFLVGKAVNRGSDGRGGRAYQLLAVGLTYLAIATTYVPLILRSLPGGPDVATLVVNVLAAPVLAGFRSIISLLIFAFALFEAWRINARAQIAVTGPYRVGAKSAGTDVAPDTARG